MQQYTLNNLSPYNKGSKFSISKRLVEKYADTAGEYEWKCLLLFLSGVTDTNHISGILHIPEELVVQSMSYWVNEGVLLEYVFNNSEDDSLEYTTEYVADKIEEILGIELNSQQSMELETLLKNCFLPRISIDAIFEYLENKDKINLNYIFTVINNWGNENITTQTAIDNKLKELYKNDEVFHLYRQIIEWLGIYYRNPTQKTLNYVKVWSNKYSKDKIRKACEITRENAERPNFKYLNSVLNRNF